MSAWREVPRETLRIFSRHDGRMLAGATAFFTLISVAPLLLIALFVAGALVGERSAQDELFRGVGLWLGRDSARALHAMLTSVRESRSGASVTAISVAVVLWGSTRLFSHLQRALDHLWGVRPRERDALRDKAIHHVRRRLLAFAMVIGCGAVVLSSLAFRAVIVAAERTLGVTALSRWRLADLTLSLGAVFTLFAFSLRFLSHARVAWRDVLPGAALTTALFALGRVVVGAYLGRKGLDSAFGAAGSVVALMLWTYYSSQIFFLGAAFVAAHARHRGRALRPSHDAVSLRESEE